MISMLPPDMLSAKEVMCLLEQITNETTSKF